MDPVCAPTTEAPVEVPLCPSTGDGPETVSPPQDQQQVPTGVAPVVGSEPIKEDDTASSSSSDDDGAVDIFIAVLEGTKQVRTSASEFIDNVGLQSALQSIDGTTDRGGSNVWSQCDCKFPHDILGCTMLHSKSETMRLSKTQTVRIKGLIHNPGLEHLLRKPTGGHQMCTTKKEHDPLLCKFLHRDPRAVPVGRERYGYLPEELVDNQGYRHLLVHNEHSGRWCSNTSKHEPKTCLFLHRAPKRGESLGKRNLNISKDGKLTIKAKSAFEKKPRQSRVVASAGTEIPEFAKKQQALDRLVEQINRVGDSSDSEHEAPASALHQPPSSAPATESNREHGGPSPQGKKIKCRNPNWRSSNPALWIMAGALLLALLVQLLPAA